MQKATMEWHPDICSNPGCIVAMYHDQTILGLVQVCEKHKALKGTVVEIAEQIKSECRIKNGHKS